MSANYYQNKLESLRDIFGTEDIRLEPGCLAVKGKRYPIIDDVIILLDPSQYPASISSRIHPEGGDQADIGPGLFAEDIQNHYSRFWKEWSKILPYQEREFNEYFDLVDLNDLKGKRVCDLGCGMGRFSYLLEKRCELREIVMIDFSDALFSARQLLKDSDKAIFFMADILRMPFRDGFADFIMTLGVLHHLPVNCLDVVRNLKKYSSKILVYLYYALDNKPFYCRLLLRVYTPLRLMLCRIRSERFRLAFSWFALAAFYMPFIGLGYALRPIGLSKYVPLFEEHHWAGLEGMRHSAYDRFFTRIEQRVTRKQIQALNDTFANVNIADGQAYWHFLCENAVKNDKK